MIMNVLQPDCGRIGFAVLDSAYHPTGFTSDDPCFYTIQSQSNDFLIESIIDQGSFVQEADKLDFVDNGITTMSQVIDNQYFYDTNTTAADVFSAMGPIGDNTEYAFQMQELLDLSDATIGLSTGRDNDQEEIVVLSQEHMD